MIQIPFSRSLQARHVNEVLPKVKKYLKDIPRTLANRSCLEYIENNLDDILGATADELKGLIETFRQVCPESLDQAHPLHQTLKNDLFGKAYRNWSRWKDYNPYTFVEKLGLKTCPYCNRNYIFSVNKRTGKLRPQIDHFCPQANYPFLSMSFGNLIPSCSTCNHTKSNRYDPNLINPYLAKDSDNRFTIVPNTVDFAYVESKKYDFESFDIEIRGKAAASQNIFKLKELYEQHKDIVVELLVKKKYYPESYIEELKSFGFNEEEVYRFLMANYLQEKDFHKRPLSKLIKDISQELGLI